MKWLCVLALLACSGQQFEGAEATAGATSAGSSSGGGIAGGGVANHGGQDAGGRSGEPAGGSVAGVAGGELVGGEGGAGGGPGPPAVCAEHPLSERGSWSATSSPDVTTSDYSPPMAIDGVQETRWSSGQPQAGNEWLQVDFGVSVALSGVGVSCCVLTEGYPGSLEDYGRAFELRVSNVSQDFAAVPVAAGPGVLGGTAFSFAPAVGRYLLVSQVGTNAVNWWSVHEISVSCE